MEPQEIARGRAVWMLAAGQTLGYACLYYIFAALILSWQADLGWDKAALALGPTIAIFISAGLAPVFGRWVDRGYGPEMLAGGAALGALALVWLSQVTTQPAYLGGWAAIGVAQAACLYEVCFAFLIRRLGPAARMAIIRVTLIAGFASTLAFPAGAMLADIWGWRGAVLVAALVAGLVVLPLNWLGAREIRRLGQPPVPVNRADDRAGLRRALQRGAFWLLAGAFALVSLNHWMIVNFLVPIFVALGATQAGAVLAASLVGPSQVAGRLVLMRYETRIGTGPATVITIAVSVLATGALWLAGVAPQMIFAFALLQGAALGVLTILRPVMIAEVLGQAGYGAIAGVIQIPALLAGALAPVLGALILSGPGLNALLVLSLSLSGLALLAVLALARLTGRS